MTNDAPSDGAVASERSHSRMTPNRPLNRVTFRLTDEQLAAIESLIDADVYHSRSEAIRTGIERLLEHHDRPDDRGSE